MARRDAAQKTRRVAGRGKTPGSGGKKRGQLEIDEITEQVAIALLYNQGRQAIAKALGAFMRAKGYQADDTPMPISTVEDYIRRANELLKEQRELTREEARQAQVKRLKRRMLAADADKRHKDALAIEGMLSDIEGTKAPKEIEVGAPGGGPLIPRGPADILAALEKFVAGGPKPPEPPPPDAPAAPTAPDGGANGPTEA